MSRTPKPRKRDDDEDDDFFGDILNETDEPKERFTKDGWPTDVPILTADDINWQYSDSRGRRDLFEWLEATFNPEYPLKDTKQFAKAYRTLCEVITERFKKKVTVMYLFLEFTYKHKMPCKAWQAACWNEMLVRLGYEVPRSKTKDPGFKAKKEDA
jgi:hypothetical protein